MAQQCTICGKRETRVWQLAKLRGKYNPTTKKKQEPNLQWTRVDVPGTPGLTKRVMACTKCIKALAKNKRKTTVKTAA